MQVGKWGMCKLPLNLCDTTNLDLLMFTRTVTYAIEGNSGNDQECEFGYHDPIIAELLSATVFTILWVPFIFVTLLRPTLGGFKHAN